jgi:hypothetical protein
MPNTNTPGNNMRVPRIEQLYVVDRGQPPRRRRRRTIILPEDDPFVLLDMVDETGGVKGDTKPMRPTAATAFRRLCMMPPTHQVTGASGGYTGRRMG